MHCIFTAFSLHLVMQHTINVDRARARVLAKPGNLFRFRTWFRHDSSLVTAWIKSSLADRSNLTPDELYAVKVLRQWKCAWQWLGRLKCPNWNWFPLSKPWRVPCSKVSDRKIGDSQRAKYRLSLSVLIQKLRVKLYRSAMSSSFTIDSSENRQGVQRNKESLGKSPGVTKKLELTKIFELILVRSTWLGK